VRKGAGSREMVNGVNYEMPCMWWPNYFIVQPAYANNPERHYCLMCGRELQEHIHSVRTKRSPRIKLDKVFEML
jgi:hypothetical protein